MPVHTPVPGQMPPCSLTLAAVAASPAAPSGEPCDRVSRLLQLVRSLVLLAADGSNGPQRRAEAHRLAAQSVRQARAVLDSWAAEHAYRGEDTCSWAGTVIVDLNDALAAVEVSVGQLGALPAPVVLFTKASGIKPPASARRAGGAR